MMNLEKLRPGPNALVGLVFLTGALVLAIGYRRRIVVKKINWKSRRAEIQFVVGGEFRTIKLDPNRAPANRVVGDKQLIIVRTKDHADAYIKQGEKTLEHLRLDFTTNTITK